MDPLLPIITRSIIGNNGSIIGNNGSIITYYWPEQLGHGMPRTALNVQKYVYAIHAQAQQEPEVPLICKDMQFICMMCKWHVQDAIYASLYM